MVSRIFFGGGKSKGGHSITKELEIVEECVYLEGIVTLSTLPYANLHPFHHDGGTYETGSKSNVVAALKRVFLFVRCGSARYSPDYSDDWIWTISNVVRPDGTG